MFDQGLFETMRCYDGRIFALKEHLARLKKSCAIIGIKPPSESILKEAINAAIKKNFFKDARLRLDVSKIKNKTHVSISIKRLPKPKLKKIESGFSVLLASGERIESGPLTGVKCVQRTFYDSLFKKSKKSGYDEAIFCNRSGEVAEGTRANVFIVKDAEVITPALSSGCLPGITRKIVIRLLKKMKIPCRQRRMMPYELFEADEIFLTNSVIEVVAVTRLNKEMVSGGKIGDRTKKIMALYKKEVEKQCFLG